MKTYLLKLTHTIDLVWFLGQLVCREMGIIGKIPSSAYLSSFLGVHSQHVSVLAIAVVLTATYLLRIFSPEALDDA